MNIFNHRHIKIFWIAGLLMLAGAPGVWGQVSPSLYEFPYHHIPWYTIESQHFKIHFQEGNSRSAQVASRVAEEVYPYITNLYSYKPDSKTSIVLKDREDYSNGAAYFFDNKIDIWIPALDTPLRGTHDWLRNVVTHEFTHIVQLQASMKRSRGIPAIYFQWLSYSDVRRPDVLYGFPNGIITYPFSSITVPAWFAEGVAQFQRSGWTYDTWDSHRDMVLRTSVLNDEYLSFDEMGTFASKNSLEREKVYNQGFAFTGYIIDRFGENALSKTTNALSESGTVTIDRAIERATGINGRELFKQWLSEQKEYYESGIRNMDTTSSRTIESEGFLNFHPKFSPDQSKIAYLSNKQNRESGLALYIKDLTSKKNELTRIGIGSSATHSRFTYSCGLHRKPLIDEIRSVFSFSPDGKRLVYVKTTLNAYGERYNDLFLFNLENEESNRLTKSRRIYDPAWSPDGKQIIAIQISRGTANLVSVDLSDRSVTQLTGFSDGEQLFTPVWHPDGDAVYFSYGERHGRSIKRLNLNDRSVSTVLHQPHVDFRDPFIDPEGLFLYYAADPTGIFNIYRVPIGGGKSEQLTNVVGGAFMPNLNPNNRLIYSEYRKGGYKIAGLQLQNIPEAAEYNEYHPPTKLSSSNRLTSDDPHIAINSFNDSIIDPLPEHIMADADTGRIPITVPTTNGVNNRELYRYEQTLTRFSVYPIVRFDNYSKLNGSNSRLIKAGNFGDLGENLLRDMKVGAYFASREVTDRLSFFGGALLGLGSQSADGIDDFFSPSRLTDLDRDLFLIMEYRGLPFIEKRWSPTLSLEFYNLRRNVQNGLEIEEFPCTSCLPDTLSVDIAFNIWEADLFLRSRINEYSLVELGVGYTPYRIQTDGFFSRELSQFIPSSSTEYFRGVSFSARYIFEHFRRYPHMDTAPIGLRASVKYAFEPSELLETFEVEDGVLSPVYDIVNNHSVELSSRYGFPLKGSTAGQIHGRFFHLFNQPDDAFYLDYIGGFTGMRSYPFFGIGGTTTAYGQLAYIFPVITDINRQMGRHTLDKLFLRLFAEAGNGWKGPLDIGSGLKSGIGAELRFSFSNYYLYPLKFFISGAYGFNKFDVNLPSEFITESGSNNVSYGKELLFHFGLTFDFEILNRD